MTSPLTPPIFLTHARCQDCGRTTTATPPSPCPRSKFTCGFLAGVKVLIEGLPHVWHAIFDVFNGDETAVFTFALTKQGDELAAQLQGRGDV